MPGRGRGRYRSRLSCWPGPVAIVPAMLSLGAGFFAIFGPIGDLRNDKVTGNLEFDRVLPVSHRAIATARFVGTAVRTTPIALFAIPIVLATAADDHIGVVRVLLAAAIGFVVVGDPDGAHLGADGDQHSMEPAEPLVGADDNRVRPAIADLRPAAGEQARRSGLRHRTRAMLSSRWRPVRWAARHPRYPRGDAVRNVPCSSVAVCVRAGALHLHGIDGPAQGSTAQAGAWCDWPRARCSRWPATASASRPSNRGSA